MCKICSKEQSMKFAHNWKTHYLTHSSNEDKPHKCTVCGKGFITLTSLTKHQSAKHAQNQETFMKKEESLYKYEF